MPPTQIQKGTVLDLKRKCFKLFIGRIPAAGLIRLIEAVTGPDVSILSVLQDTRRTAKKRTSEDPGRMAGDRERDTSPRENGPFRSQQVCPHL